ncbi:gibberellin-regulated protein 14-like [Dendrobium catenatum]|uniref:gibberellin-regulated protein 14-like n=1 Tax=Dendrobium catenatum TaxID=906689 RepID=UPI00109EFEB7|nr:gibberellin-regulated protein 14-like [Dendrobium catenatum]
MASFVSSVTFSFGSDARVTLPESLLASPPAGGITFDSFTDSAFVTVGGPTPAEAAPVRPVAKQPVPRPLTIPPVHPAVRRPVPTTLIAQVSLAPQRRQPAAVVPPVRPVVRRPVPVAPIVQVTLAPQCWQPAAVFPPICPAVRQPVPAACVAQVALAPQCRQPIIVVTPVVPVEVPRVHVPPPTSTRKRGSQTEVPSPSSGRIFVFVRLSHPETAGQTPTLLVVPVPPAT